MASYLRFAFSGGGLDLPTSHCVKRPLIAMAMIVAASIAFLAAATTASASSSTYCGSLVAPFTPCSDHRAAYDTSDAYNQATYSGGGYISVCEKIITGGVEVQRYCNPAACNCNAATSGTITSYPFQTLNFYVGNNSVNNHTINGYYAVDF